MELRLCATDDSTVLVSDFAVAVQIFQLHGSRSQASVRTCGRVGILHHAFFQQIVATTHEELCLSVFIDIGLEVIHCIETVSLEAPNQSERLSDDDAIVVAVLHVTTNGVRECLHVGLAFSQLVNFVLIEANVEVHVQRVVLVLQDDTVQCQFDTSVRGLADVLLHLGVTDGSDGSGNEQVLHSVPVKVDATGEALLEEAEVETYVTCNRGLPLQVGVGQLSVVQRVVRILLVRSTIVFRARVCLIGCLVHGITNSVVTGSTE